MKTPLVIYHYPCLDGFAAAWACWLKHPDWEFFRGTHGEKPPYDLMTGRDVFLLDFSYQLPEMEKVINQANSVTVLDHHKTAEANIAPLMEQHLVYGKFDMMQSGAALAWHHFHPGVPMPYILMLIEDRDLWRRPRLHVDTDHFTAYLFSIEYNFEKFSQIYKDSMNESLMHEMLMQGFAIERKQDKDTKELIEKLKYKGFIGGIVVPIANVPYQFSSSIGELMAKEAPFAATYFFDGDHYIFSLRSAPDGIDVSEIAKLYGGGGHKHSAGFQVSRLEDLR
jgi:uncharacterized protein